MTNGFEQQSPSYPTSLRSATRLQHVGAKLKPAEIAPAAVKSFRKAEPRSFAPA